MTMSRAALAVNLLLRVARFGPAERNTRLAIESGRPDGAGQSLPAEGQEARPMVAAPD